VIYGISLAGILIGMVIGFNATIRLLAGKVPKGYVAKVENVRFLGRRRR
jgi:hypothetical protein